MVAAWAELVVDRPWRRLAQSLFATGPISSDRTRRSPAPRAVAVLEDRAAGVQLATALAISLRAVPQRAPPPGARVATGARIAGGRAGEATIFGLNDHDATATTPPAAANKAHFLSPFPAFPPPPRPLGIRISAAVAGRGSAGKDAAAASGTTARDRRLVKVREERRRRGSTTASAPTCPPPPTHTHPPTLCPREG
jgi:hypothetical protein